MMQYPYSPHVPSKTNDAVRVAFLGDVVGRPGRTVLKELLPRIKEQLQLDVVIANGENAAGGAGIDAGTAQEIRAAGAQLITLGDHAFQRKGVVDFLNSQGSAASHAKTVDHTNQSRDPSKVWCIRPLNHPRGTPGYGWCISHVLENKRVLLVNLIGRVFVSGPQTCPFHAIDDLLQSDVCREDDIVVVDFHAEATSEKWAMARFLDGRASLLVGTHTHVQTADAQILSQGLGYITDLGMCGSNNGVIGMKSEVALKRFLSPTPAPYEVAEGASLLSGVVADLSLSGRRALWISPLRVSQTSEMVSQGTGQD
jgi:metallophosphoesterase (TIGR00282 family)